MMTIDLSGTQYEIEGLLYAGRPACSLRKAGVARLSFEDFDRLSVDDEVRLRVLIKRYIAAVALPAGVEAPP